MKKLIIQIPCWNEESSIGATLAALPRHVSGFEEVEWLVIDDGSTDNTVSEAKKAGVHHVVSLAQHEGLAAAFETGIHYAHSLGATVVVNTDADNQYDSRDIEKLTRPILEGSADLVVGDRHASKLSHLPRWKQVLYALADWTVSGAVGQSVPDPTSGFRAMNRLVMSEISLRDNHSYTLESLIQAYFSSRNVKFVPVRTHLVQRPSRLITSTPKYILKTTRAFLSAYFQYAIIAKIRPILFPGKAVLEGQD